jgi:hypothetical protein
MQLHLTLVLGAVLVRKSVFFSSVVYYITCVALPGDVEVAALELRELAEPVEEEAVRVLRRHAVAELPQVRRPVRVGEPHAHRRLEEQQIHS